MKHFLIMAGGTGGHIFPALATAKRLVAEGAKISWLGTKAGLEAKIIPQEGFELHTLWVSGLRGKGLGALFKAPFQLVIALLQALWLLRRLRPNVVLGMGGFVTGPGGLAARLLGIPLVIHEQNAIAGTTNRVLSRFATQVLSAFPGAFGPTVQSRVTGNPVRSLVLEAKVPTARYQAEVAPCRVLILGGSRGALMLNKVVPRALKAVQVALPRVPLEIWHQCGAGHEALTEKLYQDLHLPARVVPFIQEIEKAYDFADLVICRAGALTVSELAAVGLPAILVPFPHAIDDHQTHNAAYLAKAGAAIVIQEVLLNPNLLAQNIIPLLSSVAQLRAMAVLARGLGKPTATEAVALACMESSRAAH